MKIEITTSLINSDYTIRERIYASINDSLHYDTKYDLNRFIEDVYEYEIFENQSNDVDAESARGMFEKMTEHMAEEYAEELAQEETEASLMYWGIGV